MPLLGNVLPLSPVGRSSRSRKGPPPPEDLGPVPFGVTLKSEPVLGSPRPPDGLDDGVGLLAELSRLHASAWRSAWSVHLGPVSLRLKLPEDLGLVEEFWVFLLELVASEEGEWSLLDGERLVTIEAQVFGPDAQLEISSSTRKRQFRGQLLPGRATVRLRAVVAAGAAFFGQFLTEARRVGGDDLAGLEDLESDLRELVEAVSSLPGTFKDGASR